MKRYHIAMLLMLTACSGNQITVTDDPITDDPSDDGGITVVDGTIGIVFSENGATVTGDELGLVSVDGNDVTVINTSESCITYNLSGSASDGFFKLYSDAKQVICLNGLSLTNPDGAAINNQSHKYTSVVLAGNNSLADGCVNSSGSYNDESSDEDMKAAFFSEGQLIFSGDGSLTVTAVGKAGITSDDYIRITENPTITVSSKSGHGIRGKEKVLIEGGTVNVSTAGNIRATSSDDAINSGSDMTITGGNIYAFSSGNNGIVISHPDLVSGSSYTLKTGSTSTTVTATLTSSGSTGGPGGGGFPGGGGGPGGRH